MAGASTCFHFSLPKRRCACHAHRAIADRAHAFDDVALVIEIHVGRRGLRRALAIVEEVRLAVHVQRHETAAADVARFGIGDRQREGDGDRCVDGIAAFLEDLFGGVGAVFVGDGNRGCGEDGLRRRGRRFCNSRCRFEKAGRHADERDQREAADSGPGAMKQVHWESPTDM
jgi:hypothetical protein